MSLGDALLTLSAQIFGPVVIDATAFLVCFNVGLKIIELARAIANPKPKGGE